MPRKVIERYVFWGEIQNVGKCGIDRIFDTESILTTALAPTETAYVGVRINMEVQNDRISRASDLNVLTRAAIWPFYSSIISDLEASFKEDVIASMSDVMYPETNCNLLCLGA